MIFLESFFRVNTLSPLQRGSAGIGIGIGGNVYCQAMAQLERCDWEYMGEWL